LSRHGRGGPAQRPTIRPARGGRRGVRHAAGGFSRCRPAGRAQLGAARSRAGVAAPARARLPCGRRRLDHGRGCAGHRRALGGRAVSEFELLRNITIGQYLPTASYLHRLDPRAKILAAIIFTVAVSFTPTILGNLCLFTACAALIWLGHIPPSYALRGLIPALPFLVILAVLQLLFFGRNYDPGSPVIFQWGWIVVTAAV